MCVRVCVRVCVCLLVSVCVFHFSALVSLCVSVCVYCTRVSKRESLPGNDLVRYLLKDILLYMYSSV